MDHKALWLTPIFALSLLAVPGCGSDDAEADAAGACTVTDLGDGTSAIRCPDGTELVVQNGKDGDKGDKGDQGDKGNTGEDGKDGKDGKDAEPPCSLAENADGTHSLTCGGKTVVVGDDCEGGFQGDLWVAAPGSYFHDSSLTLFQATSCTWIRGSLYVEEYERKALPKALARIDKIDGDLYIGYDYGNDELESVSFPELKSIGEGLHIMWNYALKEIDDFPKLETIGERFSVDYNVELQAIGDFPVLTSAESLAFRDSPKLESIGSFDELVNIGNLEWYGLDGLTDMGSFPRLERAGVFKFGGNHSMESLADFPELEVLEGLAGYAHILEISDNEKLASIDGLKQVTSVGGDVYIGDNPELDQSDVDDLLDGIDITGDVNTCGNKGGASC